LILALEHPSIAGTLTERVEWKRKAVWMTIGYRISYVIINGKIGGKLLGAGHRKDAELTYSQTRGVIA